MIDDKRDWVITTLGKVVRRDKASEKDVIPEVAFVDAETDTVIRNSFSDKEKAYAMRDRIIDITPNAFLPKEEQPKKPGPKSKAKAVEQDEFRELLRSQLMERLEQFWTEWAKLPPGDKCAIYKGLLLFAYSKAPTERTVDPLAAKAKKDENKRAEAASRISQGLHGQVDTNFEE